jgi:hypothetical protein
MMGDIIIPCPECCEPLTVDWEAVAAEPENGYPGSFALVNAPDICPHCGEWISGYYSSMRTAALAALDELRRTSP